jgi:glycosyltransferase involved in cell wall biosynthesis
MGQDIAASGDKRMNETASRQQFVSGISPPRSGAGTESKPTVSRRLLIASYHYPPDAAVGGLRVAKFTRYLLERGWQVHVLTVHDHLRESGVDLGRLRGLEQVPVVKTGELPHLMEALVRVKSWVRRRRRSRQPATAGGDRAKSVKQGLSATLTRYLVSILAMLPDNKKNWSLRAAGVAPGLIRRVKSDWILTSGPPFSVHVIGVVARMFTGVRWIADFRDPWIDMLLDRAPGTRSRLSDAIERWMEALVVRWADRVVTTTERMRDAMLARYPSLPSSKFVCIPNSIDTEELRPTHDGDVPDRLTITYAGTLYFDRTPEPLFRAVADLIKAGRATAADIRIVLAGDCRRINDIDTEIVVRRHGLEDVVEVIDRRPYPEAVAMMQRSHLLLLLAPVRHRLVVPAKIYDYLGTGTVVLALAEPAGATADLMNETQCGRCFSHDDVAGIREYLASLLDGRRYQGLRNRPEVFARFNARTLTGRLASEMLRAEADARGGVVVRA